MAEFYCDDWYCLIHDFRWNRANDEWTTPRRCPKWLEEGGEGAAEDCEIMTIGDADAGEKANRHDADLEDRRYSKEKDG